MSIENYNQSQDYMKIKRVHSNSKRFTDTHFSPCNESIGTRSNLIREILKSKSSRKVEWKRAKVNLNFFE